MDIILNKDNNSIVRTLTKEQQQTLKSIRLSYEDITDKYVLAMLLGHHVDNLEISIKSGIYVDGALALMLDAKNIKLTDIECCDDSFNILSKIYPHKVGQLRRAKMLGKDLLEVVS